MSAHMLSHRVFNLLSILLLSYCVKRICVKPMTPTANHKPHALEREAGQCACTSMHHMLLEITRRPTFLV